MTVYRIWVIGLVSRKLYYARHFPHLEKRDGFVFPNISPAEFTRTLLASLGIDVSAQEQSMLQKDQSNSNWTLAPSIMTTDYETASRHHSSTLSRSSSSSSVNSVMSSSTIVSSIGKTTTTSSNATIAGNDSTHSLYNYLPLIVCRFMNHPRDVMSSSMSSSILDEHQKFAYIDLLLLVYEKNGFLFVCCPRLHSHFSMSNIEANYEQLLLDEENISLSFSALQLISTSFFTENKSIKHLELFISSSMPFGTLIRDGSQLSKLSFQSIPKKETKDAEAAFRIVVNEFISTSFQNFGKIQKQAETNFGTLVIENESIKVAEFSRANVNVSIGNLGAFSLSIPTNTEMVNSTTLNFDLKHSKLDPFNILHYRLNSSDEDSKQWSPTFDSIANFSTNKKLFSYKYAVSRKIAGIRNVNASRNDQVTPKNCHHITLTLFFNPKLMLEEIKFAYFIVKFSLNQGKSKIEIQTTDSSVSNLIIRDSIVTSYGQVRSEGSNFLWVLGPKMPKSGKFTLDFDLWIDEAKLINLDTICNFRFEHKMAMKLVTLRRVASENLNTSSNYVLDNTWECNLRFPAKMIEPQLSLNKLTLFTEKDTKTSTAERKQDSKVANTVIMEYRLSSFEYRLFADLPSPSTM